MTDDIAFGAYKTDTLALCDSKFPAQNSPPHTYGLKAFFEGAGLVVIAAAALVGFLGHFVAQWFGLLSSYKTAQAKYQKTVEELRIEAEKNIVRAADPIYRYKGDFEHEAVNMVLVGEGGSGKTTLIRAFSCVGNDRPITSTATFETYSMIRDIGVSKAGDYKRRVSRIYVDDYVGQRSEQITNNEELKKRQKFVKKTTLVIVVDLFAADRKMPFSMDKFDLDRIKYQVSLYSNPVVRQTLAGMLRNGDEIIIFVNKIDILKGIDQAAINRAKKLYDPLLRLFSESKGLTVHVVVGSASKGWGVIGDANGNMGEASLYEIVTASGASISEATLLAALKENAVHGPSNHEQTH